MLLALDYLKKLQQIANFSKKKKKTSKLDFTIQGKNDA